MESNISKAELENYCPVHRTLEIVGKKWTLLILREFQCRGRTHRYNEILKSLYEITPKVLSARLQEMVAEGLLNRKVYSDEVPVRVEYTITKKGKELEKLIDCMREWGKKWSYDEHIKGPLPCQICSEIRNSNNKKHESPHR